MNKTIGVVIALKDQCTPQIKSLTEKMGITEKETQKLKKGILGVSKELGTNLKPTAEQGNLVIETLTTNATALGITTQKVSDRIDNMSNKLGNSDKTTQSWNQILTRNGITIETLEQGIKTLTERIASATDGNQESIKTFNALGISIKDNTGKIKTQEEVFNEVLTALQQVPQQTMKVKYANTLLGRSGKELMPIINATTQQVVRQRQEYDKLGIKIKDITQNTNNKYIDTIGKINTATTTTTTTLKKELLPISTKLFNTLQTNSLKLNTTFTPTLQNLSNVMVTSIENMEGLKNLSSGTIGTFSGIKTLTSQLGPLKSIQTIISGIANAQGNWNTLMLSNPIGITTATMSKGVVTLWKNWDKVTKSIKNKITPDKNITGNLKSQTQQALEQNKIFTPQEQSTPKYPLGTSYLTKEISFGKTTPQELISPTKISNLDNNTQAQKFLTGNKNITVNLNIAGNVIGNREFTYELMTTMAQELRKVLPV